MQSMRSQSWTRWTDWAHIIDLQCCVRFRFNLKGTQIVLLKIKVCEADECIKNFRHHLPRQNRRGNRRHHLSCTLRKGFKTCVKKSCNLLKIKFKIYSSYLRLTLLKELGKQVAFIISWRLCALELKKLILIYLGASTNKW